jgi:Putative esterase
VIIAYVHSANPYYDDSYAVDSANVGPYGTAINNELIPAIEKQYRGIGQGWARATFGGSTGGWEALATQVFYPDKYNGAFVACPDPVDFHAYQNIDLYNDTNAFVRHGDFGDIPIAADRNPDGTIIANTGPENAFEYVLGTHGRSTEQWNIWQAVFSPAGPDGYPAQVVDPLTGAIDKKVVAYWHDHYDLTAILKRDWATLGPKLEGKLHIAVGDGDTYFLNNAVHLMQDELDKTRDPHSDAAFQYGPRMPHCYTGGPPEHTMIENNANWTQRVLPLVVDHMLATAPAGADVTSWRY